MARQQWGAKRLLLLMALLSTSLNSADSQVRTNPLPPLLLRKGGERVS